MNLRKALVSAALAAGLSLTLVAPASARPWFWHDHHDRYEWRHSGDRAGWFNHWRYDHDDNRWYRYDRDGYRPYRFHYDRD
jgi:hypothetical protein